MTQKAEDDPARQSQTPRVRARPPQITGRRHQSPAIPHPSRRASTLLSFPPTINRPQEPDTKGTEREGITGMATGFLGTFVLSWSQTELDGLSGAGPESIRNGSTWAWHGEAVQVDGPSGVLRLDRAEEERDLHRRAARKVRRLIGTGPGTPAPEPEEDAETDGSFVLTDGRQSYLATLIALEGAPPLVMFLDDLPPQGRDLWIVRHRAARARPESGAGMICFTPGTRIATAYGPVAVEDLAEGDHILTRDNGPQPVLWAGARHVSGARLIAEPDLRPVRVRAGAFGTDRPDGELMVSPDHRLLVTGAAAQALFNTPEVLVRARDLTDGRAVVQDMTLREVTYHHLLLPAHQVIWANRVECESFHPANAALSALTEGDRARLLSGLPELEADPFSYGQVVRRNLTRPEAAILRHAA